MKPSRSWVHFSLTVVLGLIASTVGLNSSAKADEISSAAPGVFRIVVVARDDYGDVVGLGLGTGFAVSS